MAFSMAMDWNEGESKMQSLLHVPPRDNPTSAMLTPQAAYMLQRAPLLAIGTLDNESRPWTALWGGAPGFSEPIGGGFVGTRTLVDGKYDPVVQALVGSAKDGEMALQGEGKLLSGLAIDLVTRKRAKIAGKMAAGTLRSVDVETDGDVPLPADAPKTQDQIQLVSKIEQSIGNCPKYLNQYDLQPALLTPSLLSSGSSLSPEARALVDKADMFFLSTSSGVDMDTNYRGGAPGFLRSTSPSCIVYPEYSGNRFYQSLGNLQLDPHIGVTVPDLSSGAVLYMTGTAEILIGPAAEQEIPSTSLAVKINITDHFYVDQGLAFRGTLRPDGYSPYNPRPRPSTSLPLSTPSQGAEKPATLLHNTRLTPTITRLTFSAPRFTYNPGQYIALSFPDLDQGYSHMRDSDPQSLNDNLVRTFTISSAPASAKIEAGEIEFSITLRSIGRITTHLLHATPGFQANILGVGGEFIITQDPHGITPFIAGGVGITPLLGQLATLNVIPERLLIFWAVGSGDVGIVLDLLKREKGLGRCVNVFVSGDGEGWEEVRGLGARVEFRRLGRGDLEVEARRWYVCAGGKLRESVMGWLAGREVVSEGFDY